MPRSARCSRSPLAFSFVLLTWAPPVLAHETLCSVTGQGDLGFSLAAGGDFDGDGARDWIVGEPHHSSSHDGGRIELYSGSSCSLLLELVSAVGGGHFGYALQWVSDLDGDGKDEFLVGEPDAEESGLPRGRVYLFAGGTGNLLQEFSPGLGERRFGAALARLGDVDLDGYEDWAVGAPNEEGVDGSRGTVSVFSGGSRDLLFRVKAELGSFSFGRSLCGVGDSNGDGVRDFVVGYPEPENAAPGQAFVYSGADGTLIHHLESPWDQGRFGYDFAELADLDADAVADFLVGAPTEPNRNGGKGNIHVISGATGHSIRVLEGDRYDYSWFGGTIEVFDDFDGDGWQDIGLAQSSGPSAVRILSGRTFEPIIAARTGPSTIASLPDRDGDGRPELLSGHPSGSNGAVIMSSLQPLHTLRTWYGASGDRFGERIWSGEDVDGDGLRELLVSSAGGLTLVSPADGEELFRLEDMGTNLAWIADVDGDGKPDFAHWSSWHEGALDGRVTIHSGADGSLLQTIYGEPWSSFGGTVAALGDVDGDGMGDLAVGSQSMHVVQIYSTGTWALLRELSILLNSGWSFGESVLGLEDIDGDARAEVLVTETNSDFPHTNAGAVHVFSGATGVVLLTIHGSEPETGFGAGVSSPADFDQDGRRDVCVWTPGVDTVSIYSGRDLALLDVWESPAGANHFGETIAEAGDVDGDGWTDVAIAAPITGDVFVFSSTTGAVLQSFEGSSEFGSALAGPGDVDGDGFADLAIGDYRDVLHGLSAGAVHVFAGGCHAPAPVSYCLSAPNSTGTEARMSSEGSTSVALEDFVLVAEGSLPNGNGLFVMSDAKAEQLFGEGWRCVGQPFYRFPMQNADTLGRAELALDLTVPPALGHIVPSSGWFFQWWYRDPAGGGSGFNASDGLAATFCP